MRRQFTTEFKAQAVERVLDGRSLAEVATELGLSTGQHGGGHHARGVTL